MKRDLMRLTNTHIYLFSIFVIAYMYTDTVIKYITRPTIDSCFSFLPGETYRKLILGSNGLFTNIKYINLLKHYKTKQWQAFIHHHSAALTFLLTLAAVN